MADEIIEEPISEEEQVMLDLIERGYNEEIHEWVNPNKPHIGFKAKYIEPIPDPIRIITTGAMQTRFSISEEIAIVDGTDSTAKVLLSRLFNSKNINLDLEEFTYGLGYIVPYLDSIGMLYLDATIEERMDKLTEDGTADEAYH